MNMKNIEVDQSLCDHCNLCVAACKHGGLTLKNGQVLSIESGDCDDCRICEFICDRGAINWNYQVVVTGSPHY